MPNVFVVPVRYVTCRIGLEPASAPGHAGLSGSPPPGATRSTLSPVSVYQPRQAPSVVPPTPTTCGSVAGAETQASEPALPTEATRTTPRRWANSSAWVTLGTGT